MSHGVVGWGRGMECYMRGGGVGGVLLVGGGLRMKAFYGGILLLVMIHWRHRRRDFWGEVGFVGYPFSPIFVQSLHLFPVISHPTSVQSHLISTESFPVSIRPSSFHFNHHFYFIFAPISRYVRQHILPKSAAGFAWSPHPSVCR